MRPSRETKNPLHQRRRFFLYSAPIILLIVILAGYLALNPAPPVKPALEFTWGITIQVQGVSSNGTRIVQGIFPGVVGVSGVSGAAWATSQYNNYGIDGRYPIYITPQDVQTPNLSEDTVHVNSTVVRNYKLSDFFAVWGEPLGQNDTARVQAQWKSSNGTANGIKTFWFWHMYYTVGGGLFSPGQWGAQVLQSRLIVFLCYSDSECI